jgi:hypothetical protein
MKSLKEILFEFEFKDLFEKSLKRKRKKRRKLTSPPFWPGGPTAHHSLPAPAHAASLLFLFFSFR